VTFDAKGDMCAGFFAEFWNTGRLPVLPPHAQVLEIGCAENDWLACMRETRPDLYLVGIDQRGPERPSADEHLIADVLTHPFAPCRFDAIIAVSMIEWAGCGHYKDPIDPDGDLHTLQRARTWIKPTGWLYFDVPYREKHDDPGRNDPMRTYSDEDFERLFWASGWRVEDRQFFRTEHRDGPYMAHLLRPE
jgi:hypothetical protein